jgi:hypothetical protein
MLAELADLLLKGGPGLPADPARAAAAFNEAAEEASAVFKAKLSMQYFEKAALAESMADD